MDGTYTGLSREVLLKMVMPRVRRGLAGVRRNPVVTQLDALNDLIELFYKGDRRRNTQDRIAALFYLFLEAPAKYTRMPGVDNEDVRQDVIAKLWDWLVSGHLRKKKIVPIRTKGWFGTIFKHQAIDHQRKMREASLEGIPEIASTGIASSRVITKGGRYYHGQREGVTEEQIERAQRQSFEYSGKEASTQGPATVYLRRWYGRRPDVVLAVELGVTLENLRVRAHRAKVSIKDAQGDRKVPELRRDDAGDLAVPVPLPRKPPNARKEWFVRWYPVLTQTELVALTGYTSWPRIRAAARRLGLPDRPPETDPLTRVGMEWVSLVYPYLSDRDMALDLGVPVPIVREALDALDVTPATVTRKGVTRAAAKTGEL